jgi:osmotically-inducible protein OsmY
MRVTGEHVVNSPLKKYALTFGACLTLCGIAAAATAPDPYPTSDAELQDRVQLALHADPYFYDGHVVVSVEQGVVHLKGMVFSDWDLRDAIRIATKASGDRTVVNNLTLIVGGRR